MPEAAPVMSATRADIDEWSEEPKGLEVPLVGAASRCVSVTIGGDV
jgi:hypothetical protein